MRLAVVMALLAGIGCKGERASRESAPGPGAGSGEAPASPVAALPAGRAGEAGNAGIDDGARRGDGGAGIAGAGGPLDPRDPAVRCAEACLYLTGVALDEAPTAFERDCGASWPYRDDHCDGYDDQVNCIYAAHGNVFEKPRWRERFGAARWYRPRADFDDAALSATERASVRALRARGRACRHPPAVSAAERELVTAWFDRLTEDGGDVAGAPAEVVDDLGTLRARYRNLKVLDETRITRVPSAPDERTFRLERFYRAAGGGGYEDEETMALTFDAEGRLVAVDREP